MTADQAQILFVDDEPHVRQAACQTLELAGFKVLAFESAEPALERIGRNFYGVVFSDLRMPELDGMAFLQRAIDLDPELPFVLITGHGDVQQAVEAMRAGAYDFIEKPFASGHLADVAKRALDKRKLTLENRELRVAATARDQLETRVLGRTKPIVELRDRIRAAAATEADILILGDTGTGKEVVARAIHNISSRKSEPFVVINCAALPSEMIESELFGHEIGAFPGAIRPRLGRFLQADRGCIYLDGIDSLPLELQGRLLPVLRERRITPLGASSSHELDVRFIASARSDLVDAVAANRFRSDLLYSLNTITLRVPSLAERVEDIPRLFTQLVNEACLRYRRPIPSIGAATLTALARNPWPGNVRELRNAADRFALGLAPIEGLEDEAPAQRGSLPDLVGQYERRLIAAELSANKGRLKETYESLGLSRKTLYEKMQKYGLKREDFQPQD
jgi:two-component system C4-dicarboxylate transport response regulator DctD